MKQQINIGIDGMHCAACSARVEKALSSLKGVISASVNLGLEEASIEYDDRYLKVEDIEKTIESLGYSVRESIILTENEQIQKVQIARKNMIQMWIVAIIVMVIMLLMMIPQDMASWHQTANWIIFSLTILGMCFPARKVYVSAFKAISTGGTNMDVLIAIGTIASLLVVPLSLIVKGIRAEDFSGIAAMILAFHLTGRYLETKARGQASSAIRELINLGAKTAIVLIDGEEREIPVHKLKVGDIFLVKAGAKVPADGIIIEGSANLDESIATGESLPVYRQTGDRVLGATLNLDGFIKVQTEKVGKDSFLAQVVKMVEDAQHSKVPVQLLADKIISVFVPVVLMLSVLTFFAWLLFPSFMSNISDAIRTIIPLSSANYGLAAALMAAIATLVIACPCALGLATPTALMVGSGVGAERGILIRNGEALQRMKDVKAIVFDKTGTITYGNLKLLKIMSPKLSEQEILQISFSLEQGSEHPLAKAIISEALVRNLKALPIEEFTNYSGKGISAKINGQTYYLGNLALLIEKGIKTDELSLKDNPYPYATSVFLMDNEQVLGILYLADTIRPEAFSVVNTLREMGIESILLSGDNQETTASIAKECGINKFIADALPQDKARIIKELKKEYGALAMVGDGINDAPALKQADIGIALGQGADIAIESADIVIVPNKLELIPKAIKLSLATFQKIKQNLFWAFFYNVIAIPLAIFGALHPIIAEIAMAISSVTVVSNANLLRRELRHL
ncbi:MAG TPA: heavy metal translocating P-type ATPase [Candidatus Syntrophosphaera sp.]|jgi:Cu+-exporting ATPase|nr:copper-translocating P-type ATPase [Candidatus Syntrophosphaera sp.]OQB05277.1 MAG: putative copper-importing P-type ATPase A [Candidatus Cloacimonetes bacterium ADurb.Bin211]HQM79221.1 heavy metal translocating P-type ATPase [Candidatus Syntrophosphaera sp.]